MKRRAPERKSKHAEAVILFGVGEHSFAIAAAEVDEIRDTHGLVPAGDAVPCANVRYRLVRERRSYWVVDASAHFRIPPSHASRVLVLRHSNTAVLVDHIDRMAEIGMVCPLPQAFQGEERVWYRGLALVEGAQLTAVPVVNSEAFLPSANIHGPASTENRIGRKAVR